MPPKKEPWPPKIPTFDELVAPSLQGAACAGRSPLFDGVIDGESAVERMRRQAMAKRNCRICPVIHHCEQVAHELPPQQRQGIWHGEKIG